MFIYLIRNKKNGKVLVGQTIRNINLRWKEHKYELRHNKHFNPYLQKAWNKYGEKTFEFVVIKTVKTKKELDRLEEYYRQKYSPKTYNLQKGGQPGNGFTSKTTIELLRKATLAQWTNPKTRKQRLMSLKKMWNTPEKQQNILNGLRKFWGSKTSLDALSRGRKTIAKKLARYYKGFISPTGKVYSPVIGLTEFCRKHGLTYQSLGKVNRGQLRHHKGWRKL